MDGINITSAQYATDIQGNNCSVTCVIDGETLSVPIDLSNRHYAEIMRQVEAGTLVVAEAD
jgi:hypothetical protein